MEKFGSGEVLKVGPEDIEEDISNKPLLNTASWILIPLPYSSPFLDALISKYTQSPGVIEPEFSWAVKSYDPVKYNGLVFTFCRDWVIRDSAWIVGLKGLVPIDKGDDTILTEADTLVVADFESVIENWKLEDTLTCKFFWI